MMRKGTEGSTKIHKGLRSKAAKALATGRVEECSTEVHIGRFFRKQWKSNSTCTHIRGWCEEGSTGPHAPVMLKWQYKFQQHEHVVSV